MFALFFIVSLFISSLFLTGLIRRYAISVNLLDIPNHRSSHTIPTPRGGGLGFVLCFFAAIGFLTYTQFIHQNVAIALGGAGFLVALLGFLDDKISLPARVRLLGHIVASIFALSWIGLPQLFHFSWILIFIIGIFYLVWLLNLYNFMDGIDGIAAIEALSVCLGMALIYGSVGAMDLITLPLILAAAVAGFLFWNLPPARIFMGDVGSGFLGLMLGILSLHAACIDIKFIWAWLILLAAFIVDATFTLIQRILSRQAIFDAHRTHAYQQASKILGSHSPVTLGLSLINIFWLFPLALSVVHFSHFALQGLILAYLPLIGLAWYLKAGAVET